MTKIELTIKRETGNIEVVDVTNKFNITTKAMFNNVKENIEKRSDNVIIEAKYYHTESNLSYLIKSYNKINNEGHEGYVPENSYFMGMEEYTEKEVIDTFK